MAITLLSPEGTVALPKALLPQATTEPSNFKARLLLLPAAIAAMFVAEEGTEDCEPQLVTVPSALRARLWFHPAAMAMALVRLAGGALWLPQTATVPLAWRAM